MKPTQQFFKPLFLIAANLSMVLCSYSWADTSVWRVDSGDHTIYIGGTIHLLRPSDYPLPPEFDQAYEQSSEIFFETDISSMSDLSVQTQMLQQLTYSEPDTSLKTVLSEEAYEALADYVGNVGMPIMMMERFRPGLVVSTLQVLEFQRMGFTPEGVDAHFNKRALADSKDLGQLEPVEAQINFIAEMGEGNESEFILMNLEDMSEIEAMLPEMIAAWRDGDSDKLDSLFIEEMQELSPELYDSLLVDRNNNWMPIIEQMLVDSDTEFVLVGAAHLVGKDGLLSMLAAKGYQVSQL